MAIISGDQITDRPVLGGCTTDSDCGVGMQCLFGICKTASSSCIEGATSTETSYPATGYIKFTTLMCVGGVMTSTGVDYFCDTDAGYGRDPAYSSVTCTINNKCTGCIVSCSCSSVGYSGSCSGSDYSTCYTSCSKACNPIACPSGYSCTYNSGYTYGTQYYGSSTCSAQASFCTIATQTCNTSCSSVANRETRSGSESCTRSCSISNGTCSYSGSTRTYIDTCSSNYTGGGCQSAGASCSGCNSWSRTSTGECTGGTISITCNAGYYLSNGSCVLCESGYYCPGDNSRYNCPNPYTYAPTSLPANYYSSTVESASVVSGTGLSSAGQCYALFWFTNARGGFYEYISYNSSAGQYVASSPQGWHRVNPGYYLKDKAGCGSYAYYYNAEVCPANSYCPGKDYVVCNGSNQSTVHTTNFGLNSCPSGYPNSGTGSDAASDCYTSCTKACTQQSCPSNATCTHGSTSTTGTQYYDGSCSAPASTCPITVTCNAGYYLSNGTCVPCAKGTYSSAGATSCTACSGLPPNAEWTGSATSNACPWRCNAGYYLSNGTCAKCEAGYYCPGNNSRGQCTGATYQDETGKTSCKSCPTATKYASMVSYYWYWSSDGVNDHLGGCRAEFNENDSNGNYALSCAYYSGDYGVTGSASGDYCMANPTTCIAGKYAPNGTGGVWTGTVELMKSTACVDVGTGYWSAADSLTRTQCPSGYQVGGGAASQGACVGAFTKTGSQLDPEMQTGCSTRTLTACTPGTCTYYKNYAGTITSDCTPTNCTKSQCCTSVAADYYISSCTPQTCSSYSSTYTKSDGGSIDSGSCYTNITRGCTQNNGDIPSGCASVTAWNACSCTGDTYIKYASGTTSGTTSNETCTKTPKTVTANSGNYVSGTTCPTCSSYSSTYTLSDGGNIGSSSCYTNITRGCTQNNGSTPSGCASVTAWNACSCTGGTYVKYANGSTSGTTTNETCTKTPKTVTANANRYVSGTTCPSCPTAYPLSDGGSISDAYCYVSKTNTGSQLLCSQPENSESYTCGTCNPGTCNWRDYKSATDTSCTPTDCNQPVNPGSVICNTGYYTSGTTCPACTNAPSNSSYTGTATSNACPWSCNDGYNLTSDNQCAQYCAAGVTHIHLGTGLKIPLYSVKRTTPSINVRHNGTVCYADLIEGESTGLHVKYNGKTYHAAE